MAELTLQINTSGAWKNVVKFDARRKAEVVKAAAVLSSALGEDTSWCLLHESGRREWLSRSLAQSYRAEERA